MWSQANDILSTFASGFIIAGAVIGSIASIVHWRRKKK